VLLAAHTTRVWASVRLLVQWHTRNDPCLLHPLVPHQDHLNWRGLRRVRHVGRALGRKASACSCCLRDSKCLNALNEIVLTLLATPLNSGRGQVQVLVQGQALGQSQSRVQDQSQA